jgi:outer membrane receptor for ferrienterochelin and colicin
MKKYIFFLLLCLYGLAVFSEQQVITGVVVEKNGTPVVGANVFWRGTQIGTSTNITGAFELPKSEKSNQLIVSFVAYKNDTIPINEEKMSLRIVLDKVQQLAEVEVVGRAAGLINSRTALFQTQKISTAELQKAACCNLSESFETNPSVDVTYSDAATGAKQIKLLGLSGTYVQMLTENVPTLRGIAAPYGLGYTPGTWMESIQVSKGTSSVLNGYEALTGQINVEYLKPEHSDRLGVNLYASDAGRLEANVNAGFLLNKKLSSGLLLHVDNTSAEWDMNGDGFLDQPKTQQYNVLNRWDYRNENFMSHLLLRYLHEEREGGQLSSFVNPYKIGIAANRYEFFAKNGYILNEDKEQSIALIVSGSYHEHKSFFDVKSYDAGQANLYANFIFQTKLSESQKLSSGASVNLDDYAEVLNTAPINKTEVVSGIFSEYTLNRHDKFILLAGVRADYSSLYGFFLTPRVHLKYTISPELYLRTSVGKGYRSPNVLAENSFLLASSRELSIAADLQQEEAWNGGVSATAHIPLFGRELTLQGEWYHTRFIRQVVVDLDTDPHKISIYNLNGQSYANSAQLELSYEILRGWTLTAAHRITDTKTTYNGVLREKPLTSRYKSLLTTSYQTPLKKWQFDFTAQFNGGGRMPDADIVTPLWDKEFKPYTILNAQITKNFRTWSVYIGGENLTNFTQTNPIIDAANPFGENFDAAMVWGPLHGRTLYVGMRWALSRDK